MSSDDFVFQRWRSADRDFWNHEQGSNSFSVEACNRLAARAWLRIARQGLITVVDQSFSFQSAYRCRNVPPTRERESPPGRHRKILRSVNGGDRFTPVTLRHEKYPT